jgi:hypothetical protein
MVSLELAETMRVDEMATRALYMINKDSKECLNVGRGEEGGNATTTADLGCSAKNREASGYWTVATRTRTSVGILLHQAKTTDIWHFQK